MKIKLLLAPLAMCILAISCVNKDYDLDKLDSEMTVVPGLTTTVTVNKVMEAKLYDIIKNAPGYNPSLDDYVTDADGNYNMSILPDWDSKYTFGEDFDIKDYMSGLDDAIKTLAAKVSINVDNKVALPLTVKVNGKSYNVPASGKTDFTVEYDNILALKRIEAEVEAGFKKGTSITLNKEDKITVTVPQAVVSIPDGITVKF